jgi:hypothetical protein
MDFEPAQGGGVAGQGSSGELCRGDGDFSLVLVQTVERLGILR